MNTFWEPRVYGKHLNLEWAFNWTCTLFYIFLPPPSGPPFSGETFLTVFPSPHPLRSKSPGVALCFGLLLQFSFLPEDLSRLLVTFWFISFSYLLRHDYPFCCLVFCCPCCIDTEFQYIAQAGLQLAVAQAGIMGFLKKYMYLGSFNLQKLL